MTNDYMIKIGREDGVEDFVSDIVNLINDHTIYSVWAAPILPEEPKKLIPINSDEARDSLRQVVVDWIMNNTTIHQEVCEQLQLRFDAEADDNDQYWEQNELELVGLIARTFIKTS